MNRRKYMAGLGLIGIGGYASYNTVKQPSIAANVDFNSTVEVPTGDIIQINNFNSRYPISN